MSTGYPKILHDNRLDDATPSASSTASGYNVLNLRDWRPFTWWKPSSLPATVTVDCGIARAADYAYLYGHTLHDAQVAVEVRGSTDNFAASDVLLATSNFLAYPEDFSNAIWTLGGTASVTGTDTINLPADDDHILQNIGGILDPASRTITLSWKLIGSGTISIFLSNGVDEFPEEQFTLSSTPTIYSITHAFGATSGTLIAYLIKRSTDSATQVIADAAQMKLGAFSYYQGIANGPLFLPFASVSYRYWRFRFVQLTGSVMPTVAIAAIGEALEVPAYFDEGFDPVGRAAQAQYNRSVKGHPLGSVVDFEEWEDTLKFSLVNGQEGWDWVRETFLPAWRAHLRSEPFGLAWDPDGHPGETILLQSDGKFETPHKSGMYCDLSLGVSGVIS
jgi:hypothetical protein